MKINLEVLIKEELKFNKETQNESRGKIDLNIYGKGKKKCWVITSPYYFKKNCPYISCFYMNQPGKD